MPLLIVEAAFAVVCKWNMPQNHVLARNKVELRRIQVFYMKWPDVASLIKNLKKLVY